MSYFTTQKLRSEEYLNRNSARACVNNPARRYTFWNRGFKCHGRLLALKQVQPWRRRVGLGRCHATQSWPFFSVSLGRVGGWLKGGGAGSYWRGSGLPWWLLINQLINESINKPRRDALSGVVLWQRTRGKVPRMITRARCCRWCCRWGDGVAQWVGHSDSRSNDRRFDPARVRSTRTVCEFFRVKNVVLTSCRCVSFIGE